MVESSKQVEQEQLNSFVSQNTILNCPQRSQQWYDLRLMSFGGSEIASLMGDNKYKSQKMFFKEKKEKIMQGMGSGKQQQLNERNIMDWGCFFEPIHRDILGVEFDTSIQECSLTLGKGILKGCHQSPDGLSVVDSSVFQNKCHIDNGWVDRTVFEKPVLKVLWEQKCPSFRNPNNQIVPTQYIGQIKLGLSLFDICDIACFSDSLIRICSSYSLTTKTYNKKIVNGFSSGNKEQDPQPLYVGFIDLTEVAPQIGLNEGDVSSELTAEQFNLIMEYQRQTGCEYTHNFLPFSQLAQLRRQMPKAGSYICWKMVKLTAIAVEKSHFFPHILSTFITIGQQELNNKDRIKQIGNIAKLIKQLNFPLEQTNQQDAWYRLNKTLLIDTLQNVMESDWQSLYVLLYLLTHSQDESLQLRANSYVQNLKDVHMNNAEQLGNLQLVLDQLDLQ